MYENWLVVLVQVMLRRESWQNRALQFSFEGMQLLLWFIGSIFFKLV